jgi:hypothetical protein
MAAVAGLPKQSTIDGPALYIKLVPTMFQGQYISLQKYSHLYVCPVYFVPTQSL